MKLRVALAFALSLCIVSSAQAASNAAILLRLHMAWDRDALNYFNALVSNGCTTPTTAFKVAINNYITAEKTAKNWGYQDFAYILATADSCTASINLAQPNLYKITWAGACTYSVANGFGGDTATCTGDTNVAQNALTRTRQNNSHIFLCVGGSSNNVLGGFGTTGTYKIDTAANKTTRVSSTTQFTDTAGGGPGCHFGDRTNATQITTGKNGVVQSNAAANNSNAPTTTHTALCNNNTAFCTSASNAFFAEVGQALPNELAHYNNVRAMLVALGAQGI